MGITQLNIIKELPYLVSNGLAVLTCFPLAISVIGAASRMPVLFNNYFFVWIGCISYEMYLVHAFTLGLLEQRLYSVFAFLILTMSLACGLNCAVKRSIKNGRFNGCNIDKK